MGNLWVAAISFALEIECVEAARVVRVLGGEKLAELHQLGVSEAAPAPAPALRVPVGAAVAVFRALRNN